MRKYLMTGVAALAICAAFTSCSKNEELFNQGAVNQNTADQVVAKYNQAFLSYVGGTIDPEQTWGFGGYSTAGTRSINVNGNLWKDCPTVGTKEESDVLAYLNTLQTKEKNPVRLENYFVTQIHKGDETYRNVGGGEVGVGSDKMNNLHIAMSSSVTINDGALSAEGSTAWDHINNFNAGNCTDWSAGTDNKGNTMVIGGGTFDFAYQGSEDSKYHNRWCSIDGANVPRTDGVADNYAGNYYICFDFEQSAITQTVFYIQFGYTHLNDAGREQTDNKNEMFTLPGSYQTAAEIVTAMGGKFTYEGKVYDLTAEMVNGINIEGGNQVVNPNSSYKDWIIRLVKAEREVVTDPDDVCIIAEDLNADNPSDFDFNDVVFTVHYTSNTAAEIEVYAAGATQLIKIGKTESSAQEVHQLFADANNNPSLATPDPTSGLYKMINTGDKADVNGLKHPKFSLVVDKSKRGDDVEIWVNKFEKVSEGVYKDVNNWIKLTATKGTPAAKLCVGADFATNNKYCKERQDIRSTYPMFYNWVKDHPTLIWWY